MQPTVPDLTAVTTARKQRWIDFYDPSLPPTSLFIIHYLPGLGPRPFPRPDAVQARIEWAWQKYQIQLDNLAWLEDDALPFLDTYTGTEVFAESFGCPVHYPENDMPFALPVVHSAEEAEALPIPGLDAPAMQVLFEIGDALRRRAGGQRLVRLLDMQTPMDVAALIWDKATFYPAMIEKPEAVKLLAGKVKTFQVRLLDAWFERYGKEFMAHYPDYYMPCGLTFSEDEVGAVSGKMFNEFFLPEVVELAEHFGPLGMHCCAHARHQWENFKKIPNLALLNFVQPPEVTREAYTFFAGIPQFHSYQGEGPAWTWPAQHPDGARMVYEVAVHSKEEALETAARLRAALPPRG
jgi:hypothetical protein